MGSDMDADRPPTGLEMLMGYLACFALGLMAAVFITHDVGLLYIVAVVSIPLVLLGLVNLKRLST